MCYYTADLFFGKAFFVIILVLQIQVMVLPLEQVPGLRHDMVSGDRITSLELNCSHEKQAVDNCFMK